MRGVYYDVKTDPESVAGHGNHIGFIAQEVEKLYPELVITGKDGYKAVAYDKIGPVLLEGIKELFAKVMGHERRLASVEADNAVLKTRAEKAEQENAEIKARLELIEKTLQSQGIQQEALK